VVALTNTVSGPPTADSLADYLRMIHNVFRHELTLIRKEVVTAAATGTTTTLGAQLRINCLKFCQGLHNHHTGESTALFPTLAATHPELADTIDQLDEEHRQIATLVDQLQTLLTEAPATDLVPRLDTLIEALNRHLTYEEDQLLPHLEG
jgi:hemerythrin-like domain-containing protein